MTFLPFQYILYETNLHIKHTSYKIKNGSRNLIHGSSIVWFIAPTKQKVKVVAIFVFIIWTMLITKFALIHVFCFVVCNKSSAVTSKVPLSPNSEYFMIFMAFHFAGIAKAELTSKVEIEYPCFFVLFLWKTLHYCISFLGLDGIHNINTYKFCKKKQIVDCILRHICKANLLLLRYVQNPLPQDPQFPSLLTEQGDTSSSLFCSE